MVAANRTIKNKRMTYMLLWCFPFRYLYIPDRYYSYCIQGRKGQTWTSLGSRFSFEVRSASCHSIRPDCCPRIKKHRIFFLLFFLELLCLLLACGDTFQAAELCGVQQLSCLDLKWRAIRFGPSSIVSLMQVPGTCAPFQACSSAPWRSAR